jgi:hypothetical protein
LVNIKSNDYKQHQWKENMVSIGKLILGIIALGVVVIIIRTATMDTTDGLFSIFKTYGPPTLDQTNNFKFTAEGYPLADKGICTQVASNNGAQANSNDWECPVNKPITFSVSIRNEGFTNMRKFHGGIVVCPEVKGQIKDKTCLSKITRTSTEECVVLRDELKECDAGTYAFTTSGKYRVYPAAECFLGSEYGCYTQGASGAVKVYGPDTYTKVTVS